MRWLRRIFGSAQARDCRFVLSAMSARFQNEIAWDDIERKARLALDHDEDIVRRRILVDGDRTKDVVGDIVAMICLMDLASGADHVYRGVLGIQGQSKRNIFASIVTDQLKDGWITVQEAAAANVNVKRAVAEAG